MRNVPELPRRTIEELALRYELEPEMRDVFVEGPSDYTVVRWFIDNCVVGAQKVAVFSIDDVDVPLQILTHYGLTSGNRSEVIALCLELEQILGSDTTLATGIIDRDIADLIPDQFECSLLLKTDYGCLDMYLLSHECLTKMLRFAFPKAQVSSQALLSNLAPILQELSLLRAANYALAWGMEWPAFDRFVSAKNGVIEFRLNDFKRHYLQNGGYWLKRTEFEERIESFRAKLSDDYRVVSNGHDAICLLGHFLRSYYKKSKDIDRTHPHVLPHLLNCALEVKHVFEMPLFKQLLRRLVQTP